MNYHNIPKLLFLDEPTTGLDPRAAQVLWNNIKGSKDEKKTIVLTTHSMEEIERYCDRVIVLKDGKVVANDSPKNLIKAYKKEFFTDVYFHLVESGAQA